MPIRPDRRPPRAPWIMEPWRNAIETMPDMPAMPDPATVSGARYRPAAPVWSGFRTISS